MTVNKYTAHQDYTDGFFQALLFFPYHNIYYYNKCPCQCYRIVNEI